VFTGTLAGLGWSGFNPCFPGSSAESSGFSQQAFELRFVSILVFLDQALKACGRDFHTML